MLEIKRAEGNLRIELKEEVRSLLQEGDRDGKIKKYISSLDVLNS